MIRVLALALAAALATPAHADNAGLTRLTLRGDLLGWEAVGRLDLGGAGFCTGVLLAPDLVLTAAHCLADAQAQGSVEGLRFRAGLADGVAIAEAKAARAVLHPAYLPGRITAETIQHDVGLVQLAEPIPAAVAAPYGLRDLPRAGAPVAVVSYARGREDAPSRQAECTVVGRAQELLAFDCDVTFGSSGAPIFDVTGGRPRIVSLVSSGGRDGRRVTAFGMELPARVAELKRAFATGEGVFPQQGFTARRIIVGGDRGGTGARFVRP
ncbi:trypsin-like serine peptidase [Sinisalibacter aestuarii]|uniref:Serine protease n=1 Tax=Sinisalibacter aestuarii TaxID=2949426 RepID=A0ABQ5LTD0_9RHOB|nr:serine protease [Sinisalibacter aestuarii]GKY88223.1 serine protease [Sinisalibacter aestuarii]